MSRAILFLHTLDDARYAAKALGLPLDLIPQASLQDDCRIRVTHYKDLENAYRELCTLSTSDEFTAIRQ